MTLAAPEVPLRREATPGWWPWVRLLLALPLLVLPLLFILPPLMRLPVYEVTAGKITARSVAARTVIPAGTPVTEQAVQLSGKIVGSTTSGYTVGRFATAQGGTVQMYADGTQGTRALVFATQPEATVLTPADPQALLRTWRAGETAEFRPARAAASGPVDFLLSLMLVPLAALLFSRPQIRYTREGDELVVRTARSVTRLPRTAQAHLTRDSLGFRLFGTAMPGYYTGTFAMNGGNVQAAATHSRPGEAVLVTHAGKRYYLTPEDPQALAEWFRG